MDVYCGYCGMIIFEKVEVNDFNGHRTSTYFEDEQFTIKHGVKNNCKNRLALEKLANKEKAFQKEFKIWKRTKNVSVIYW